MPIKLSSVENLELNTDSMSFTQCEKLYYM